MRREVTLSFILTMPVCASWNGKWSGDGRLFAITRRVSAQSAQNLANRSFSYRWNDGWCASVSVKAIDSQEARRIRKASEGFCGYEWMVDSLLEHGAIYANHQKPEAEVAP